MPGRRHAVVIGGSVGGLFAASLLRTHGWSATIYERSSGDLAGRGAGIGMTRELLDVMTRVGARFDASIGVPVKSFVWLDGAGALRHEQPRAMVTGSWVRIYRPLRRAFPDAHYRAGMALERVEQDGRSITAVFADGTTARGDLLVAADGSLSTLRRQFLPAAQPSYAGYVAWRGMVDEWALPADVRDALGQRIVFSFDERELMLTMSNPALDDDARSEDRRVYFIWYRPTDSEAALRDLFTDADGKDHGLSIPPPAIRPGHIGSLKRRVRERFSHVAAEVVERTAQPLLQAISDFESPRLVFGRAVLLGDSAFVARPHVAGGITKAALDADALARALAGAGEDIDSALARYETEQRDFGAKLVAHARRLGSYIDHKIEPGAERFLDPQTIMREYGAPHLLHDPDLEIYARPSGESALPGVSSA